MSDWIAVKDRLPEPGLSQMRNGLFLAVNSGHVQLMSFVWSRQSWESISSRYDLTVAVTHWMPLPEPPDA